MPGDIQHAKHPKDFVTASDLAEAESDATVPQQPAGPFIAASLPLSSPVTPGRVFYSPQPMPMCLFLLKSGVTAETGVQAKHIHAEAWFINCLSKDWAANIENFKGGKISGLRHSAKAVHMYRLGISPNITSLLTAVVYLIKSYRLIILHN